MRARVNAAGRLLGQSAAHPDPVVHLQQCEPTPVVDRLGSAPRTDDQHSRLTIGAASIPSTSPVRTHLRVGSLCRHAVKALYRLPVSQNEAFETP
ncbi:hypothetical protein RHA1_ro11070 (plasmid) [Rhodococcus jostii RHA1]|uniref:Uncharacterized protein n=1 Tax=Rhodococcus jostii (strain RHA1) TaxID=101510 RepID=Q0RVG9_RHOJR|nr:hypothetical protein RHA1_ro11070 [Rhodococcus jostii RHA1]